MEIINVHEAKTHLSRLLMRVSRGETVVIAKAGVPVAKMVPYEETPAKNPVRLGFLKDAGFKVPDDFDEIGKDEIAAMFYGKP
jgi:prevent-host-death family protein